MLDLDVQLLTLAAGVAVMLVTWLISIPTRDVSFADVAWGLCFVAIAWIAYAVGPGAGDRSILIAILVTLWGLRLAAYIGTRHNGEDYRYRQMREKQGDAFIVKSLFRVFLVQAAVAWIVSAPVQVAATDATPDGIGVLAVVGGLIAAFGIAFETTSDAQLARFLKREGSGDQVMDEGLWRFSRHPNYFGETCVWWGIWLIALETGSGWWTAIGPALITFMLLRVSGVALTEKSISSRRPGYAEYIERTSAFVPLPPKD